MGERWHWCYCRCVLRLRDVRHASRLPVLRHSEYAVLQAQAMRRGLLLLRAHHQRQHNFALLYGLGVMLPAAVDVNCWPKGTGTECTVLAEPS